MEMKLVIIPCGNRKIWKTPKITSQYPAKDAYIGPPFKVNREYAESSGCRWMILSARYGYIDPDDLIENYNETFNSPTPLTVTLDTLKKQVRDKGLFNYSCIIGLGGENYRTMIQKSFLGSDCRVEFPFAGLPIGKMMAATKMATRDLPLD